MSTCELGWTKFKFEFENDPYLLLLECVLKRIECIFKIETHLFGFHQMAFVVWLIIGVCLCLH